MTGDFEIWKLKKIILGSSTVYNEGHHMQILLFEWSQVLLERLLSLIFWIYTYSSPIIFLLSNLKLQHMMFIVQSRYNDFLFVIYRFNLTDKFLSIVIFCRSWLIERIRMKLLFVLDKASHWTASQMLLPNHCTPVDCCLTLHQPLLEKEAENQGIRERRWRAGGCIHWSNK